MKVLLVGVHFESSFAWSVGRALRRLGHEVAEFDYRSNPLISVPLVRTCYYKLVMPKKLLQAAARVRPHLILICKGELIGHTTVELLRQRYAVPIVNWFPDARLYSYREVLKSIPFLDRLYTKNREDVRRARLLNLRNVAYLPHCADVELHGISDGASDPLFQSEVSFVGACYPYRDLILSQLTEFDLKVWGPGWKGSALWKVKPAAVMGREARGLDQARVFHQSVVNLNTHHFDDLCALNQRVFDICGSGGFQIVDHRGSLLGENYDIGREIEGFESIDELQRKIRFYLSNRSEARAIGLRARERTMGQHTYDHRVKSMLHDINSMKGNSGVSGSFG